MKRGIAAAVLGLISFAGGCAAPAQYVEKRADGGTVAIPANTNMWPTYNRREALALIQQHVGPYYEIVDERQVVTGQNTTNSQTTNTDLTQNKRNPNLPGVRETTTGSVTTTDLTQWQITYRRVPGPAGGSIGTGGLPGGLAPAGGFGPAGGPGTGVVPSVLPGGQPGVQPAGGARTGVPLSYFAPRPGAAPAASDCAS